MIAASAQFMPKPARRDRGSVAMSLCERVLSRPCSRQSVHVRTPDSLARASLASSAVVWKVRHHAVVQHGNAMQLECCVGFLPRRVRLCTRHQARCTQVKRRTIPLVQDHGSAGSVASGARGTRAGRGRDHLLTAWSQTTASEQADGYATTAGGLPLRHVCDEPVTQEPVTQEPVTDEVEEESSDFSVDDVPVCPANSWH